jgi:hypothetical protein
MLKGRRGIVPKWTEKVGDMLGMYEDSNHTNRHKYQQYEENLKGYSSGG